MDIIKFYGASDLSIGHHLNMLDSKLIELDNIFDCTDINHAIEYYNMILLIESGVTLKSWTEERVTELKSYKKVLNEKCARFFNAIDSENFSDHFRDVKHVYLKDFVRLVVKYKVYSKITKETFVEALNASKRLLSCVLKEKELVSHFNQELHNVFLLEPLNAEFLLDSFTVERLSRNEDLHFPNLSITEKNNLIEQYINSSECNPNYLRIIAESSDVVTDDRIRLMAKKKHDECMDSIFAGDNSLSYAYGLTVLAELDEVIKCEYKDRETTVFLGRWWFDENLDYPTLLQNFIYLFEFVDSNFRIRLLSYDSEMGALEKTIGVHSKKDYLNFTQFQAKSIFSELIMTWYYNYLHDKGIDFENIVEWFFKTYLKVEFGISDFEFTPPGVNLTFREKCICILPEIEKILKQIEQLTALGLIDKELLFFSSTPICFEKIKSMVKIKYVRPTSEEIKGAMFNFFSDQSHIMLEVEDNDFKTISEFIFSYKVRYDDVPDYSKHYIDYYVDKGYLRVDVDGNLAIENKKRYVILTHLYHFGFINYYRLPKELRHEIDLMISEGHLAVENTLFSTDEINYFDYYLNHQSFNNGYDLRNKYIHNGQASLGDTDDMHFKNYLIFLKLLTLIIIKFNDDLCINEEFDEC